MIELTDNASQLIGKVNDALGGEVVSSGDSATDAVAALNTAFAGTSGAVTLSTGENAEDFIDDLNTNIDLYDGGGLDVVVKFIHISDPHGSATATTAAKNLLANNEDIAFLFVTGDMTTYGSYNGISSGLATDFTAIGDKFLMLPGNHDTYDNKFGTSAVSQTATTAFLKGYLGSNVNWGDQNNVASYWHKDVQLSATSKLRIISLDQYEIDAVRKPSSNYFTMYSQAQVNWLIARLKELTASDYVIIATHEPPVQSRGVPSGQSTDTYPDDYAVGLRPSNNQDTAKLFVSEGLSAFGNRRTEPNINLLPRIIYAYMHKQVLNMTYNNYGGGSTPDITISEDFSSINPATFLFWLGGHRHCDIGTYLPNETGANEGGDWSDQLMLYITCGDKNISYQYDDDLGGTGSAVTPSPTNAYTYRFNEVELDFAKREIKITRHGACNTAGGRVRDVITFPFKKGVIS